VVAVEIIMLAREEIQRGKGTKKEEIPRGKKNL